MTPAGLPVSNPTVDDAWIATFLGPGKPFELTRVPLPTPGPGEVLVALSLSTICGSDLHTWRGRRHGPLPTILGHEGVGRVVSIGEGRDSAWLRRRVSWSLADSCGTCRPCTEWRLPQKCEQLFKYGHAALADSRALHGCYASHLLLRSGTHLVGVPDRIPDPVAAPANCALATLVAVAETLPTQGERAVIQGAGLLGLYGCALLRSAGWPQVFVVDRQPQRLLAVPRFGGIPVLSADTSSIAENSADSVIEVCGNAQAIPDGVRWLRPGGHYAVAGLVHPDSLLPLTGESLIRKCLTMRGVHNYAPWHLDAAIGFLASHQDTYPFESLVSPPMPLSKLDEAFALAESGRWCRVAISARPD